MRVSDDLFQLIHTLEKQEKRYLKLNFSKSGGKQNQNMIALFDEIDRQKVYNEEKIKKKFDGQKFVKQLHVVKSRLYTAILKNLDAYYIENSDEGKLQRLIHQAEILYEKGLRNQSKKLLDKGKKLAIEQESFLYVLKILQLEVLFFEELTEVEKLKTQSLEGYQVGLRIIERYRNFMEFNMMRTKINESIIKRNAGRTLNIDDTFNETELKLLKSEASALSFAALQIQLIINSIYYRLKGEMEKSLLYRKRLVEVFEQNKSKLKGNAKAYLTGLNNLFTLQLTLNQFADALQTIQKLENLKEETYFKLTEQRNLDITLRTFTGKYAVYMETNNIFKAIEISPELKYYLEENKEKIPNYVQLIFSYYLAMIYFFQLDYQNATIWFHQLLNHPSIDSNEEIHTYSRVLNLLSYFELNNERLFESFYNSTERYIKTKKVQLKFIKAIMTNLRKLNKIRYDKSKTKEQWQLFRNTIAELNKLPEEQKGIQDFRLLDWIDCKINNEPLHIKLDNKKLLSL